MREREILKECLGAKCGAWIYSEQDEKGEALGRCKYDPLKYPRGTHHTCMDPESEERLVTEISKTCGNCKWSNLIADDYFLRPQVQCGLVLMSSPDSFDARLRFSVQDCTSPNYFQPKEELLGKRK